MIDGHSAFVSQRASAKARGIGFEMTFDEWREIWKKSGHWRDRGNRKGQYVMARHGDAGPYAVGNVSIIAFEENVRLGRLGYKQLEAWEKAHKKLR